MKTRNSVSTMVVLVILMIGVLASQGWSQSNKVAPKTVNIRKQVQEFKAGVDIPKASDVLKKVVDDIENKRVPSQIYPPQYFDHLYSMGDNLIPFWADPMMMDSEPEDPWGEEVPINEYLMVDLGDLGGDECHPTGINNKGDIVGYAKTSSGDNHAFLYHNGQMQDLGTFGGYGSRANDINDIGEVVGYFMDIFGNQLAFLYSNNTMYDLGELVYGFSSKAYGINNDSKIVGYAGIGGMYFHAFLYSNGSMIDLDSPGVSPPNSFARRINGIGQIVGQRSFMDSYYWRATMYYNGLYVDLGTLGGNNSYSYGMDINDTGRIIGYSSVGGSSDTHAFIFFDGVMHDMGTLGGTESFAYGINNKNQVVGRSYTSTGQSRLFICSNGTMYDLNNLIVNQINEVTLDNAYDINDNGEIICDGEDNSTHEYRSYLLKPLPAGLRDTVQTQTPQPYYQDCWTKGEGKDSLIVVTHGWNPNVTWLRAMTNNIQQYLTSNNLANWQVIGCEWTNMANIPILKGGPQKALENSKLVGNTLGNCLKDQDWDHIHFIGHSSGGGLIQAATEVIKTNSPNTTVHCTFLDPYPGKTFTEAKNYGNMTDWSDSYFSVDRYADFFGIYKITAPILSNAYNVNVTQLRKVELQGLFISSGTNVGEPCVKSKSYHGWPYNFYSNTITGDITSEYQGFGFALSKEGGNWNYALTNYTVGNTTEHVLGDPDPDCGIKPVEIPQAEMTNDFTTLPIIQSVTGTIQRWFDSFKISSGSPAWIINMITTTNPVNFVSFNAKFVSTNEASQGLLSVIWDTNSIGIIDERAVKPGLQNYVFAFPNSTEHSLHTLSFRLDSFTNFQSIIVMTNIVLGRMGVGQPFSLSQTTNMVGNLKTMELTGEPGNYVVEASTNLVDWESVCLLVNTNTSVKFYDQGSTNHGHRFYRATTSD